MKLCVKEHQTPLLNLVAERWHAWQMIPGYTANSDFDPYVSPIYLRRVVALKTGKGLLQLTFFNAAYAAGVQDFQLTIRVLKRTPSYVLGSLDSGALDSPRCAIIGSMSFAWLKSYMPRWFESNSPYDMPEPYCSDSQQYLNRRLRRGSGQY